jgi:carbonic anhydrase
MDLVAHLVHKSEDGQLAVVGVLFRQGASAHPAIETLFKRLPSESGDTTQASDTISLLSLLPSQRNFWHFQGSLTTPPCTEGVQWFVLREVQEISKEQLLRFQNIFPMNARPVQPLNGREIRTGS